MQSNPTMSIKVYLMATLDNYMFQPSSGCLQENLRPYHIHCARMWCRDLYIRALLRNVISICGGML